MQTVRGNLVYTAFAAIVFGVIQYMDGVHDPLQLVFTSLFFFAFTFGMLLIVSRVFRTILSRSSARRGEDDRSPGTTIMESTSARPEHARRRRERRRRR